MRQAVHESAISTIMYGLSLKGKNGSLRLARIICAMKTSDKSIDYTARL